MHTRSRWMLSLICPLLLALSAAPQAFATTFTVSSLADSGAGSLRDAIASASSGDTIDFSITGTITLTSSPLEVSQDVTISGPGASSLAISGGGTLQIFVISGSVTISGLTLEDAGGTVLGGAILNEGTLNLNDCVVENNLAVPANFIPIAGGAVWNDAILNVNATTFSNNSAVFFGGAIFNLGTLNLLNSTFSGNSTLSSEGQGGAIWNAGIANLSFSTFAGNSAAFGGSGVFNGGTALVVKGTLLADNAPDNCDDGAATFSSDGYNLSDDTSCGAIFTATGDNNGVSAGLDPAGLADNGGPTPTIALLSSSPAVDAIPVADCIDLNSNPVTVDQRGVSRPQGGGCDIGAFELDNPFVAFSALNVKLEIDSEAESGFELNSVFTLGAGSDGIDPLTEPVTITVGTYSVTIPPGSFRQLRKGRKKGSFVYEGMIGGVDLEVQIVPLGGGSYQFKAEGSPVDLSGLTNPVTVTLVVGNDSGTASVTADF